MPAHEAKIILASKSAARKSLLTGAGLEFEAIPAEIDEQAVIAELKASDFSTKHIALALSERKALAVSKQNPEALVIGCDQVLELDGGILSKAVDAADAKHKLKLLRGRSHKLISAVSVTKGQTTFWQHEDEAQLTMLDFDDEYLEGYLHNAGEALTRAVGAYELESLGAWLFSEVRGDYFTILGLPLLPLLSYLRDYHGGRP